MTLAFALFAIYILLGIVLYVAQRQLIYLPQPYTQTLYPELTLTILAWLLKDTFRSDERASQIDSDTLLLVAGNDQLIPPKHASQLQSAFTQPVRSKLVANATHNDIMKYPNAQQHLKAFLQ